MDKIIPDRSKSIEEGGIVLIGKYKNSQMFRQLEALGEKYDFSLKDPIDTLSEQVMNIIMLKCVVL